MNPPQPTFNAFTLPDRKKQSPIIANVLKRCFYHWPLFVVTTILAGLGLYAYLQIAKPVYEVKASLIITNENKSSNDQSPIREIDVLNISRIIENELEILKSKQLIEQVVADLDLNIIYQTREGLATQDFYKNSPVRLILIKTSGDYQKAEITIRIKNQKSFILERPTGETEELLFNTPYTGSFGTWKLEATEYLKSPLAAPLKISILDPEKLATAYQNRIGAGLSNKLSTTVVLSMDDEIPQRGKDIINRLIYNYSLARTQEKNRETKSALSFIEKRLDSLTSELNKAEQGIETFKSSRGLTDISADSRVRLENMQANDSKLNEVQVKLTVIQGIEQYISSSRDLGKVPSALGIEDPSLNTLIERLAQLQLQREKLLATTPETNPDFEPINRQISTTKAAIKESVASIRSSLENTQTQLQTLNTRFESSIRNIPTEERQYISIKRQQGIKESLYTYLLQKREEMSVSNTNNLAEDRIVDKAYAGSPKGKMKLVAFLAALLFGLGLPIGLIYLRTILSPKITDIQEIKESLDLPIIGELPFQPSKQSLVVQDFGTSVIGEQFRALRIKLHYLLGEKQYGRVTLVTSSVSGEGKSFVSSNLALTLALSGRKTIILELDLRKPKVRETLMLTEPHPGITDFLKGEASDEDIIRNSGLDLNLDVITSGSLVANPSELLSSKQLSLLIGHLKYLYEDIIIDSPPVHLVPDAMILSPMSDITLYMIRQGFTEKSEIDFVRELEAQKRLFNVNIIFNGVQRQKYGYGYNYDLSYYSKGKSSIGSIFSDFPSRF